LGCCPPEHAIASSLASPNDLHFEVILSIAPEKLPISIEEKKPRRVYLQLEDVKVKIYLISGAQNEKPIFIKWRRSNHCFDEMTGRLPNHPTAVISIQ